MHFPPSNLASAPQFGGFSHKIPKVVLDQDQGCQGSGDGSRHQKPHKQTDYNPDESGARPLFVKLLPAGRTAAKRYDYRHPPR
ncbi:hypothetical protein [Mesorhizobium sp. M0496]|uniref:hypothetical protein n=1 Tax=Mesorhizobium sp. M0496 TaxID=2956952 RepID=UPI00333B44ED